ncbi:maleylpyruvate isomerase N-terminal domain-containing protein [Dactylosporangium salmoneum]|uniref:Mycothiol-dependent maleylpyruvate isomerase metal-binding domain-containing protein n=1 Tax=Dactylosporangium salmoneum TaxID=53361 RepID=A0ABP5TTV5_9ACTN
MTLNGSDVLASVALVRAAFGDVPDDGWDRPAGTLSWSCWETMEHMADDLFAYAGQIAAADAPQETYLPFAWRALREGGPNSTIFVEHNAGTLGLLRALDACGAMLAAVVDVAPPARRGWHPDGLSDPEGFAAMGVLEVLVHAWDVAETVERPWDPPAELCRQVLDRLFTDLPEGAAPWPTLLWATGRGELPGHAVRASWRWDGRPLAERV